MAKKETYVVKEGKFYYEGVKKQNDEVELTEAQAEALNKSDGITLEKKARVSDK